MEFDELDVVALAADLPAEGLKAGAVGTIVDIFRDPELAYEVEFTDDDGATLSLTTLTPEQVRPA
ncbi:hypothetical protein GCM10010435_53030 [Winogradskya consettensis]|uniref:DUF4926 domain-containing protein n=1 Tax=Winogradskya consettensis TaxID=113560 RepID=A0A919VPR8_9ACTN|nr:DUF4926 domain-containing protein [Actinoplanes consettensis]GIM71666.1 hypothetical protein Aco04nite_26410 [Actinoplanes consettensis]